MSAPHLLRRRTTPVQPADHVAQRVVEGTAVVYNVPSQLSGGWTEIFTPGAFEGLDDVLFCRDHNTTSLLASSRSGTLTLTDSTRSLDYRAVLPDTEDGRATHALSLRNDYPGVSIGFVPLADRWTNSRRHRTITRARLDHISPVSRPALDGTTITTLARAAVEGLEYRHFPVTIRPRQ